jgi:predicted transcriptional regulator of viral defense system
MTESPSATLSKLSDLAAPQGGFFLASQALAAAVDRDRLKRLTKQGFVRRERRGLYRLTHLPIDDKAELWIALLWPSLDRSGYVPAVLCYGTALSLYEVSTINQEKIDIAVPRKTRFRRSALPPGLRIHQKEYPLDDISRAQGLPATTLFRTIADLIALNSMTQFVDEALEEPRTRTLLTNREFDTLTALRSLDNRALALLRT